jgi:rare lipoprotein A
MRMQRRLFGKLANLSNLDQWVRLALAPGMLLLAACATSPKLTQPQAPASDRPVTRAETPGAAAPPTVGATRPRGGAYYQDDGPGDSPPPNLALIPDAEPRADPYSRAANRPYNVFGTDFVPDTSDKPFKQRGIGSWYGRKFHGQKTSSGEIYDMYAMTAAHPTLPIPSYAKVTNVATGQSVIVRVNDRGPFLKSRIMDLSYAAAAKLGYADQGSTMLEVERLLPRDIIAGKFRPNPWTVPTAPMLAQAGVTGTKLPTMATPPIPATAVAVAAPTAGGNAPLDPAIPADLLADIRNGNQDMGAVVNPGNDSGVNAEASAGTNTVAGNSTSASTSTAANVVANTESLPAHTDTPGHAPDLMTAAKASGIATAAQAAKAKGYLLQLAAFRSRPIAEEFKQKIALQLDATLALRLLVQNATVANNEWFRVQLGPYTDRNQAEAAAQILRGNVGNSYKPIIVFQP